MSTLSEALENGGRTERVKMAVYEIKQILDRNSVKYADEELSRDYKLATVTIDGKYTFTYLDGALRMMVPCQKCGMDQPSTPIRSLADISSQYENPKAMKHACMDI
jgi:hypothetical protein